MTTPEQVPDGTGATGGASNAAFEGFRSVFNNFWGTKNRFGTVFGVVAVAVEAIFNCTVRIGCLISVFGPKS